MNFSVKLPDYGLPVSDINDKFTPANINLSENNKLNQIIRSGELDKLENQQIVLRDEEYYKFAALMVLETDVAGIERNEIDPKRPENTENATKTTKEEMAKVLVSAWTRHIAQTQNSLENKARVPSDNREGLNFGSRTNSLTGTMYAPGQYQPIFDNSGFSAISNEEKAIRNIMSYKNADYATAKKRLNLAKEVFKDKTLLKDTAIKLGGRTDFLGANQNMSLEQDRKPLYSKGKEGYTNFYMYPRNISNKQKDYLKNIQAKIAKSPPAAFISESEQVAIKQNIETDLQNQIASKLFDEKPTTNPAIDLRPNNMIGITLDEEY